MTTPCYDCCDYCQEYHICSRSGGCEKCMYHKYSECMHPDHEDLMAKPNNNRRKSLILDSHY